MNTKKLLLLAAILYLVSCNVNQPQLQEYTYVPLHVGDMRQLMHEQDSFVDNYAIIGKTFRKDGREVFIEVNTYGMYSDTSYLFLQDGFCNFTAIDTPFMELKNCQEKPADGYSWYTYGQRFYYSYSYVNNYKTFAGEFSETFLLERSDYELFLRNYYGKNIGVIGAEFIDSTGRTESRFLLSYAKIDGKEYGHLLPPREPTVATILNKKKIPFVWTGYGRIFQN